MTVEEQIFQAELSAVAVWLTLHPADWCVFTHTADRLDVAVDATSLDAILRDLQDEGFRVQVDERAQTARADGHRLRVRLCYSPQFRALARSTMRGRVLDRALPVPTPVAVVAA